VSSFFDLGGTVRAQTPAATLARLRPLLPRFGITRVMAQEGLGDTEIPVSISVRPNSRFLSTSQGKGLTRELADISAIMESIETFHAERVPPSSLRGTVAELAAAGRRFLAPAALTRLLHMDFGADAETIDWLELRRLDGEPVWVPRVFISMDHTRARDEIATWSLVTSTNGLASGNTLEEALLHGLYELIERHAFYEHRYRFTDAERLDRRVVIDSLRGVPHLAELLARLDRARLQLSLRSIHGALGVPAFTAMVISSDPLDLVPGVGCGAHYLPEVAASRAITEAVQSRITYISGSRDDVFAFHYHGLHPGGVLPRFNDADVPCRLRFDDSPRPPRFGSFAEALSWTRALLERHGFGDTCYYDHRRAEFGDIPVVSVVCPGLRFALVAQKPDH
jgi:YcaO-like protein with predicted kinase domain